MNTSSIQSNDDLIHTFNPPNNEPIENGLNKLLIYIFGNPTEQSTEQSIIESYPGNDEQGISTIVNHKKPIIGISLLVLILLTSACLSYPKIYDLLDDSKYRIVKSILPVVIILTVIFALLYRYIDFN